MGESPSSAPPTPPDREQVLLFARWVKQNAIKTKHGDLVLVGGEINPDDGLVWVVREYDQTSVHRGLSVVMGEIHIMAGTQTGSTARNYGFDSGTGAKIPTNPEIMVTRGQPELSADELNNVMQLFMNGNISEMQAVTQEWIRKGML